MSKPLEDVIRELAASGKLNHFSFGHHHTDGFQASYRGVDNDDVRFVTHADPVCAVIEALTGKTTSASPKVRSRARATPVTAPEPSQPASKNEGIFGDLM